MRLCAITDRRLLARGLTQDRAAEDVLHGLQLLVSGWASAGVEFIQLREKDLPPAALRHLAGSLRSSAGLSRSKLLVNLPPAPAGLSELVPVVDGVHIPGSPLPGSVETVRAAFRAAGRQAIVSLACHTLEDVSIARKEKPDFVLFAPVFEKALPSPGRLKSLPGSGLELLKQACLTAPDLPVFALGGVTAANAWSCLDAGAAGIAAIRLFAGEDWKAWMP